MRKGLFASTLLATVGMLFGAVVGCTPKAVVYTCSINNKTELEAEWLSDAPGRAMALTITKNGEEQNALEAISDGDLTFTTSDEAVAIVVGKNITPVGEGSATITANYFGAVDSVTVTITKADTHGKSVDDPLTVAEAIAICKETGTTSTTIEYFVAGQVSAVTGEYDDDYGNMSFKIVDAVGDTESVTCYRVKPGEGIDPTIIGPKSQVIVSGTLVNYNGNTPEINAGGTIHSATAGEKGQVIEATVSEALQATILLPDNESSLDIYVITGYVIAFSGTDFYLADEKGAREATQDDFLVYGWKTPAGEDEITLNAKVKVTATLKHYVSTSTAGKYAYETNKPTSVEILEPGDAAIVHEVTYAEAETVFAGLADNETTTDKYAVTGYVISKGTWSDSFNNGDFVIGASAEATTGIKVFRWAGAKADFEALEVGERVKVTGKLQKYVKDGVTTPEIIGSTEVESLGIDLTAITLSETSKTVAVGAESFQLTATPVPAKASIAGLVWSSSNETVATIDEEGNVTVLAAGETELIATVGTVSATCALTVASGEVHADSVELNHDSLVLVLGEVGGVDLVATPDPLDTTDSISWEADAEGIASLTSDGKTCTLTAVAVGTVNVTVTVGEATATCEVTVRYATASELTVGQDSEITAKVLYAKESQKSGKYTVQAIVDDGTAGLYVYMTGSTTSYGLVADAVYKFVGKAENYKGGVEFVATSAEASAESVTPTTAVDVLPESVQALLDAYAANPDTYYIPTSTKLKLNDIAVYGGSGAYLYMCYDGVLMETTLSTGDVEVGKTYNLEGYLYNFYSTGGKTYATFVVTDKTLVHDSFAVNASITSQYLQLGNEELTSSIVAETANTIGDTYTYEVTNESIVSVDEAGVITPLAPGATTIKVISNKRQSADLVSVTVYAPENSVVVSGPTTVVAGEHIDLTAETIGVCTNEGKVTKADEYTWAGSDDSIATVIGGQITGVAEGTITVTVTSSLGDYSAEVTITVTAGAVWNDATMTKGTDAYDDATVNGKAAIKIGTSKKGGDMTITVPAGATKLRFYAAAWNGVTGLSLNFSGATTSVASVALTADSGISNNSPFTLNGEEADFLFEVELSDITAATVITLTTSIAKRCCVWGAQYQ